MQRHILPILHTPIGQLAAALASVVSASSKQSRLIILEGVIHMAADYLPEERDEAVRLAALTMLPGRWDGRGMSKDD